MFGRIRFGRDTFGRIMFGRIRFGRDTFGHVLPLVVICLVVIRLVVIRLVVYYVWSCYSCFVLYVRSYSWVKIRKMAAAGPHECHREQLNLNKL